MMPEWWMVKWMVAALLVVFNGRVYPGYAFEVTGGFPNSRLEMGCFKMEYFVKPHFHFTLKSFQNNAIVD